MRFRLGLAAIGLLGVFALPAWAHHSHGNYVDSFTDITGTVKEVHLLLPHSCVITWMTRCPIRAASRMAGRQ